jgi:hypothetical protein
MLGVNSAANGYNILAHSLASGAGINTIQATTSVLTPILSSLTGASGAITLSANSFAAADLGCDLGGSGSRWAHVFTPIIDSGTTQPLVISLNNGVVAHRFETNINAVNFLTSIPNPTGTAPVLSSHRSADTNTSLTFGTKGTGVFSFTTNADGTPATQFQVLHTASATRNITLTGSNGGNPTISTTAGSLAITPDVVGGGRFYSAGFIGSSVLNAGTLDIPTVSGGAYVVMASSTTGGQGFTGTALNVNGTLTTNSSLSAGATSLGVSGTNMRLTNSSGSTQTYNYCAIRVA